MNKKLRVLTGSILYAFCLCAFLAFPAFGQWSHKQIDPDSISVSIVSAPQSATESGQWSYEQIDADCNIQHIFALSETDIYAGGYRANYAGCLYHNDGTGWEAVNTPGLGPVMDIWGSAGDDVYAIGLGFGAGRYHYDGTNWTKISTSTGRSIWGFSRNDVFIGGIGNITRFQAPAWKAMILPSGLSQSDFQGLWGTSATDMYAVGHSGSTILHYDGNQTGQWNYFNKQGLEGTNHRLFAIWGSSAQDIFVTAYGYGVVEGRDRNLILHYDGSMWTTFVTPISIINTNYLLEIWGSGPDDVYTASYNGDILHYDGTAWSVINSPANIASQPAASGDNQLSSAAALPDQININSVFGTSAESIYFAGVDGIVIHYTPDAAECQNDSGCDEGYECVEGACTIIDNAPVLGDGPFVSIDWKVLPTSLESLRYINENTFVLWTFSDDFASCSEDCTHTAEYQVLGTETWTPLSVSSDAAAGYAYAELPIIELQNATTYAFRFAVTDCVGQSTQSEEYYFRVATSDAPPVIGDGPYLAAGSWPLLPILGAGPVILKKNDYVFWTFSDDYASCAGLCTQRVRYKKVDDAAWTWLAVSTDSEGTDYAYTLLPVEELDEGTYHFYFDVRDCKGQRTYAPNVYTFKVAAPQ